VTPTDLRRALLAERYGDVIREAHAALSGATPWTPAEQRAHLAELDTAVRDDAAARPRAKARPDFYPPPDTELREAVVDNAPPKANKPRAGYAEGQTLAELLGEWSV
jgi:hypothetical protein